MTRDDARYYLQSSGFSEEQINTIEQAFKQELCEDAISRLAALDCFTATKLKKFDFILYAREEIKKLPSVKPQPKKGYWKWVESEEDEGL